MGDETALADAGVFDLDEIADLYVASDLGPVADMGVRPHTGTGGNFGAVDLGGVDRRALAYLTVLHQTPGANDCF